MEAAEKKRANVVKLSEEMEYDPDEFRPAANDAQGHNARISTRVPPQLDVVMRQWVASGRFPYRNEAELMRHAIYRHIGWMHGMEDAGVEVRTLYGQLNAIRQVVEREERMLEFESTFAVLRATVTRLRTAGMEEEGRRMLKEVERQIKGMPRDAWGEKFKSMFEKEFGEVVRRKKSPLNPRDREEK